MADAVIIFNPPQGVAEMLTVPISDGRFVQLIKGENTYPPDAAYLLKKSKNQFVQRMMRNMNLEIRVDDSEGMTSVLMGDSASPFAPLSAADLGLMPTSNVNMDGFGTLPSPLNTPTPSQTVRPTTMPQSRQPGADARLAAQQQALGSTQLDPRMAGTPGGAPMGMERPDSEISPSSGVINTSTPEPELKVPVQDAVEPVPVTASVAAPVPVSEPVAEVPVQESAPVSESVAEEKAPAKKTRRAATKKNTTRKATSKKAAEKDSE